MNSNLRRFFNVRVILDPPTVACYHPAGGTVALSLRRVPRASRLKCGRPSFEDLRHRRRARNRHAAGALDVVVVARGRTHPPSRGYFDNRLQAQTSARRGTPSRGHRPQEITHDQSEARSPHATELADHLYRSSAADGVRRAVHRPPDAEEQRRCPRQGSEGVQDPDHYHYGRNAELLRLYLSGAARGVP